MTWLGLDLVAFKIFLSWCDVLYLIHQQIEFVSIVEKILTKVSTEIGYPGQVFSCRVRAEGLSGVWGVPVCVAPLRSTQGDKYYLHPSPQADAGHSYQRVNEHKPGHNGVCHTKYIIHPRATHLLSNMIHMDIGLFVSTWTYQRLNPVSVRFS